MHDHLLRFISNHCVRFPSAAYELKQFCADFYDTLPPAARKSWRRGRVVAALTLGGFPVGMNHGIAMVGGLAPRGQYRERDGRLELVAHA